VLTRRIARNGRVRHQTDAAGHGKHDQAQQRDEAQQLRAEPVEEHPADQVVDGDDDAGRQRAGGRECGRRFPVIHGGGHEGAGHKEGGQYGGHEMSVEHAHARVAHHLRGERHQNHRAGHLL